jgi:hypothetical protein
VSSVYFLSTQRGGESSFIPPRTVRIVHTPFGWKVEGSKYVAQPHMRTKFEQIIINKLGDHHYKILRLDMGRYANNVLVSIQYTLNRTIANVMHIFVHTSILVGGHAI